MSATRSSRGVSQEPTQWTLMSLVCVKGRAQREDRVCEEN